MRTQREREGRGEGGRAGGREKELTVALNVVKEGASHSRRKHCGVDEANVHIYLLGRNNELMPWLREMSGSIKILIQ